MTQSSDRITGAGLGLRPPHISTILAEGPAVPWWEVLFDNYLSAAPQALSLLEQVRAGYPIVLHCVGLDVGTVDPVHDPAFQEYLRRLRAFRDHFRPAWISTHLCWTAREGVYFHDLLPLPRTNETIRHVVQRLDHIQNVLGERILVENVSAYVEAHEAQCSEAEFLARVAEGADCDILLDVNNIYVNRVNHQLDPAAYLSALPPARVRQIHLAGFEDRGDFLLDTHGAPVAEVVWELFADVLRVLGPVPAMVERDQELPALAELLRERERIAILLEHAPTAVRRPDRSPVAAGASTRRDPGDPAALREFQAGFARCLASSGQSSSAPCGPADRLAVYRNSGVAVRARALTETFESTQRLLGTEFFEAAAHRYAGERNSTNFDLEEYGQNFPDFLADLPGADALPYLRDLARLEWEWHRVQRMPPGPETPPLTAQALEVALASRGGDARFQARADLRVLESEHPLLAIWSLCQADGGAVEAVDANAGGEIVLLYTSSDAARPVLERVDTRVGHFLRAVLAGYDFARLSAEVFAGRPLEDVRQTIGVCLARGWIRSVV